jgi:hypothetical protein
MPNESWIDRFDKVVRRLNRDPGYREIALRRLLADVGPPSEYDLAAAIFERIQNGDLEAHYRVRSPETGAGLGEYADILEVPLEVRDPTSNLTFRLEPQRDIEVIYRRREAGHLRP